MLRLKSRSHDVRDEFLSIPDSQPITMLQVSADNLPYACQCPLCGGVFEIPEGILYKVEEDDIPDVDSDTKMSDKSRSEGMGNDDGRGDEGFFGGEDDMGDFEPDISEDDIEG